MAAELDTIVWVEGIDKERAAELAAESERRPGLRLTVASGGRKGPWWLMIPEVDGILAAEPDPNAVTWSMDPDGLERLAATLEWLFAEIPEEFTFEVSWAEEPIEKWVTRDELLRIVRAGRLGTRACYRVRPA